MSRTEYNGDLNSKWTNPQRYKMLSGFVHVPAMFVRTPYWMKLDTDVVAVGEPDWIDPGWFEGQPAIVSHRWSYTKPADQMMKLDAWAERHKHEMRHWLLKPPLNLVPEEGATRVSHKRIISWCSFYETAFTKSCANIASTTCGGFKMPEPSQDGFHFYMATRSGQPVVRTNMKERGWQHWGTQQNIKRAVKEAMP
jgi:hypothetical protein